MPADAFQKKIGCSSEIFQVVKFCGVLARSGHAVWTHRTIRGPPLHIPAPGGAGTRPIMSILLVVRQCARKLVLNGAVSLADARVAVL